MAEMEKDEVKMESQNEDQVAENSLPTANILVAGITGTGKSTLLNAVFGDDVAKTGTGRPVTDHMDEYANENVPIRIWDTVGLELDSEKTKESINAMRETIASKALSEDEFDRIHAIWYCVNSGSSRLQSAEVDFIQQLHSLGVPFIIIMTQCTDADSKIEEFKQIISSILTEAGMHDITVIPVCAKPFETRLGVIPAFGLDTLVDTTLQKMPEFIKDGFIAAQKVSKQQKRMVCEKQIVPYVRRALDGTLDNIWLVNIPRTNRNIVNLLSDIARTYNTILSEKQLKQLTENLNVTFKNIFDGLINPFNNEYQNRIDRLFEQKKAEGFEVEIANQTKRAKAARMIAFFGYTFIDCVEEVWDQIKDEKLKSIDEIIEMLTVKINAHLNRGKSTSSKRIG